MIKGLRTAEQAMQVQLTRTNMLANNLANADATGFKQMLTRVAESEADGPAAERAAGGATTPLDRDLVTAAGGRGGLDIRAAVDFRQGPLRETGRPTDVALRGDGLFRVRRGEEELYTRNGAFTLNAQRQLVTNSGDLVLGSGGPLTLPDGGLSIAEDGGVMVDGAEVGRLAVFAFADAGGLVPRGDGLFEAPEGAAAEAVPQERVNVAQGMLEGSNVNPIDTMVAMIAAQRAFELESRMLQAADRTLDKSVNELSRKA